MYEVEKFEEFEGKLLLSIFNYVRWLFIMHCSNHLAQKICTEEVKWELEMDSMHWNWHIIKNNRKWE